MSNHYPHQNRYVPSKLLPTHCYREHNEFGIPFKRYPLNFDEHEESGYYIDFNQTHLVYAVPCTDITFSKKYNRDDLKNETIDTTAETRDTVGTTAARYHNNVHSRHYPHCAHSSHVQGFDVLTITKLMDYELQLHDVTPERLQTLFENFACPQRDTVVFEHVWMEQHKFLSRYFKVHKKPLLDYCLFRFPEPPVCKGPGPTPGEGPNVESVGTMSRYIDPETCVTYIDLLVTFTQDVSPLVEDLKTIFSSQDEDKSAFTILAAEQLSPNTMKVTTTFSPASDLLYLYVDLTKVENAEGIPGTDITEVEVTIPEYEDGITITYQDHLFDKDNNQTKVWLAFSKTLEDATTQEEVPVTLAVNNIDFAKSQLTISKIKLDSVDYYNANDIAFVTHEGHPCVEITYNQDFSVDSTYEIKFTAASYVFKYVEEDKTARLSYPDESFVLQNNRLEKVITECDAMLNSDTGNVEGLYVVFPCAETATLTVDLTKITRAPFDGSGNAVNPDAYNLGQYRTDTVEPGREVYFTFSQAVDPNVPYTYYLHPEAIKDDEGYYNALFTYVYPNQEPPEPAQGPVFTGLRSAYNPQDELPARLDATFDQDIELIDTTGIKVIYSDAYGLSASNILETLTLTDFNNFINAIINQAMSDTSIPSAEKFVDYYYDVADPNTGVTRHPGNGVVWKTNDGIKEQYPYIEYSKMEQLDFANYQYFGASSVNYNSGIFGLNGNTQVNVAINQLISDYASRNSLSVTDLLNGTHNTEARGLVNLTEVTIAHYALWQGTSKTDSEFQAHINALYNEPLGGQTYPDDAILATQSIVTSLANSMGITPAALLTDEAYAPELARSLERVCRGLIFIHLLTAACSDAHMLSMLNKIVDGTYGNTNVGSSVTYFPLTNWITVDKITFNTEGSNIIMRFNEPLVRQRDLCVQIPANAVRNPSSGFVNKVGTQYTYISTPEIVLQHGWANYNAEDKTLMRIYSNVDMNFIGDLSGITITDGVNTATASAVYPENPDYKRDYIIEFTNTSWSANKEVTFNIAQGVFENSNDTQYTNDPFSINVYVQSDVPPTPPVTNITITFDSDGGTAVESQTIPAGTIPAIPTAPTKPNHTFDYWMLGGAQYNFDVAIGVDATLKAHWTYVEPTPTPVAPTNQAPKQGGSDAYPIYVHNFGDNNSHLSLYLKYDTKVENGHSYIKFNSGSAFKCEGSSAFFGWTIQTVRVQVNGTTIKELSNVYHSTSDTNWSEDFSSGWIDLGVATTGTGAATMNVYAKSNAAGSYTGFEFNENYDCTIAHNELA